MFCTKCGRQLAADAHFCAHCGTQVIQTVSAPEPPCPVDNPPAHPADVPNVTVASAAHSVSPEAFDVSAASAVPETPVAPPAPAAPTVSTPRAWIPKPAKVRTPKAPRPEKKTKVFSAVLWSVILAISLLVSGLMLAVRMTLSAESIEKMLENVDLSEIYIKDSDGDEVDLAKFLYNSIDAETVEKYNLKKKDMQNLLEDLDWKEPASELVSGYIGYFLYGEDFRLRAKDIVEIIEDNEAEIAEATNGFRFDYDKLEELLDDTMIKNFDPDQFSETFGFDIGQYTNLGFSVGNLLSWGMVILSLVMILFACRLRVLSAMKYAGVAMAAIGLATLAILMLLTNILTTYLPIPMLVTVLSVPIGNAQLLFGGFCGVGVILFAVGTALHIVMKKLA